MKKGVLISLIFAPVVAIILIIIIIAIVMENNTKTKNNTTTDRTITTTVSTPNNPNPSILPQNNRPIFRNLGITPNINTKKSNSKIVEGLPITERDLTNKGFRTIHDKINNAFLFFDDKYFVDLDDETIDLIEDNISTHNIKYSYDPSENKLIADDGFREYRISIFESDDIQIYSKRNDPKKIVIVSNNKILSNNKKPMLITLLKKSN